MMEAPLYLNFSPLRLALYRLVTSKYFDLAISAVIGLNIITMAMEFYMMPGVSISGLNHLVFTLFIHLLFMNEII